MIVAVDVGHELWRGLSFAFGMTWEVLWALILGFALSGAVQALVAKREMRRLLPDDSPKTLAVASGLGAASSSCSYASVALARSLFRKGADFTAAMAFQFASTNLVIELGIIIALLLGWQFVLGEFVGGPLMIVFLALVLRLFLSRQLVEEARAEAEKGRLGSMEGHAEMDMSVDADGRSLWQRLRSPEAVQHHSRCRHLDRHEQAAGVDVLPQRSVIALAQRRHLRRLRVRLKLGQRPLFQPPRLQLAPAHERAPPLLRVSASAMLVITGLLDPRFLVEIEADAIVA